MHGSGPNTTKKWLVIQVGNWSLYIGIFLCCTGFGVVPGAILIFIWGITHLTENNKTARSSDEKIRKMSEEDKWKIHEEIIKREDGKCKKIHHDKYGIKKQNNPYRWKDGFDSEDLEGWK